MTANEYVASFWNEENVLKLHNSEFLSTTGYILLKIYSTCVLNIQCILNMLIHFKPLYT